MQVGSARGTPETSRNSNHPKMTDKFDAGMNVVERCLRLTAGFSKEKLHYDECIALEVETINYKAVQVRFNFANLR